MLLGSDGKIIEDTWKKFEPARQGNWAGLAQNLEAETKELRPIERWRKDTEVYKYAITYWSGFKNPITSPISTKDPSSEPALARKLFKDKVGPLTIFREYLKKQMDKLEPDIIKAEAQRQKM